MLTLGLPHALACDSHMHIFDAAQDATVTGIADATVSLYHTLQGDLGTQRAVIVQPRPYGLDNSLVLKSIAALGKEWTRGIVVVLPSISDTELHAMHAAGVRGVRLTAYTAKNAVLQLDMLPALAQRIAPLGWHMQLHLTADQIAQQSDVLIDLPCPMVFDHHARLPTAGFKEHPAWAVLETLFKQKKAWVKLSGAYFCTALPKTDSHMAYLDVKPIAQALLDLAPDRMVWGSDWPHITEGFNGETKPDALNCLQQFYEWVDNWGLRQQVMVDNPARLYDF